MRALSSPLLRAAPIALPLFEEEVAARPGRLFALLDATGEPSVLDRVEALGSGRARSLFNGYSALKYREIAPYLVELDTELLRWIRGRLWAKPWGLFVETDRGLQELRDHLHALLSARTPEGKTVFFRYFDPRLLPLFLDVCTEEEVAAFYGESVAAFYLPDGAQVQRLESQIG